MLLFWRVRRVFPSPRISGQLDAGRQGAGHLLNVTDVYRKLWRRLRARRHSSLADWRRVGGEWNIAQRSAWRASVEPTEQSPDRNGTEQTSQRDNSGQLLYSLWFCWTIPEHKTPNRFSVNLNKRPQQLFPPRLFFFLNFNGYLRERTQCSTSASCWFYLPPCFQSR